MYGSHQHKKRKHSETENTSPVAFGVKIPLTVLQARNYYQIIKRPMDLSAIRRKLDHSNTLHYFTTEQFIDDVLLMFKNCATFNYVSLK